jgi:hypothetical protein
VRSAAVIAALGICLAAPAVSQGAAPFTVEGKASVRNYHGDFIIGWAYARDAGPNTPTTSRIDVQADSGAWKYGFVEGSANRCGWILGGKGRLHRTPGAGPVADRCPPAATAATRDSNANPLAPQNIFAAGSYAYGTGGGTVYPAVIQPCPTGPYVYGNYDPASKRFSNRYGQLPAGRGTSGGPGVASGYDGFGWRHESKDGQAVLIKDTGKDLGGRSPAYAGKDVPDWVFVRSACVRRNPPQFGPGLRISSKSSWKGTRVHVEGKITNATQHPLTISFGCGGAGATRHRRERRGRFSVNLTRPAGCKGKSRGTATVSYQGDGRYRPATATRRIRRR